MHPQTQQQPNGVLHRGGRRLTDPDPLKILRQRHTPQVDHLMYLTRQVQQLADALNGMVAGILVPGAGVEGEVLVRHFAARETPMNGLEERRVDLENQVRRAAEILEAALKQDSDRGQVAS